MADTRQPKTREGGAAAGGEIPSVEGSQPSRGRQGLFEDSSKESPSPHRPPTADGSSHRRGGKDRRGRMPRKSLSGVEPSVNTAETLAKETLFTKEEKSTLLPKPLTSSPEEKRKAEDALRSKATAAARESAQRQRLVHNAEKQKQRPRHGPGGGEASSVQRSSQSARGDGSGNSSPAQQTPRFSRRFERLMQVPNPMEGEGDEAFFSDDEEEPNRIGDVPLWWYEKYRHIGYDAEGKRLLRTKENSALSRLLEAEENKEASWRFVEDKKNDRRVRLSDQDLELIHRIRQGKFPSAAFNDEENYFLESEDEDSIFPMRGAPPKKANFLPSKHEQQRINSYIKLIREGRLVPHRLRTPAPKEEPLADIWGDAVYVQSGARSSVNRGLPPPPKMALPSHAESYNPPEEYLLTPEERAEWEATAPEERVLSFVPQKFSALRRVPAYAKLVVERFLRCQALYLSARKLKMRMSIDPESLLPELPPRKSLLPFPRALALEFLPVSNFAQRLPPLQPLRGFLLNLPSETDCSVKQPVSAGNPSLPTGSASSSSTPQNKNNNPTTDVASQALLGWNAEGCGCAAVAVDSSGQWLATGGEDGVLRVFELRNAKPVSALRLQQRVSALAFHPRLPVLAVATGEQLLLLVLDAPASFDQAQLAQFLKASSEASAERATAQQQDGEVSNAAEETSQKKRRAAREEGALADKAVVAVSASKAFSSRNALVSEALELLLLKTPRDPSLPDLLRLEAEEASEFVEREGGVGALGENEEGTSCAVLRVDAQLGSRLRGQWLQVSMRGAKGVVRDLERQFRKGGAAAERESLEVAGKEAAFSAALPVRGVLRGVFILHDAPITRLRWQKKGGYLAAVCPGAGSPSAQLSIHALKKQQTLTPLRRFFKGSLRDACFFNDKPWLAVAYERGVRIYDLKARERNPSGPRQATVKKLIGIDGASSLDVHPGGGHLIVGCESRKLVFFDLEMGSRPFKNLKMHSRAVTAAAFHPKYPLMATASLDGTVEVVHCKVFEDLGENPLIVPVKTLKVSARGVLSLAWHPFMPWLFTADADGGCFLWR